MKNNNPIKNLAILIIVLFSGLLFNTAKSIAQNKFKIGQEYKGGIIFYIDTTGEHGLIVTKADIAKRTIWGRNSDTKADSYNDGEKNTKIILDYFKKYKGGKYLEETAAYKCDCLVVGDYDDWYLPAIGELVKIYEKRESIPDLDFSEYGDYCSSTEYGVEDSYNAHFKFRSNNRVVFYYNKNENRRNYCIRCIRKF